jgi:hypothetical protein
MRTAKILHLCTAMAGLFLLVCLAQPAAASTLSTAAMPGGRVWEPGEGTFEYVEGTELTVIAVPDDGYQFAGWTGTAVTAGKVAETDLDSPSITLTMDGNYTLIASFEIAGGPLDYKLGVTAAEGGYVSQPGERVFSYENITTVSVVARAYTGYRFSGWTGTAVDAGKVADPTSDSTTVLVDAIYTLRAHFVPWGDFSVRVLAPNGGESLAVRDVVPIRWQIQGEIPSVTIHLSVDGGATWTYVGETSAAAGSYDWPVPKIISDECLIRIRVSDNSAIADVSDAFFSIYKPAGHIWYVDAAAAPGGDGTSWETAFACLQDALARALDGDSVWVAQGRYWPDLGEGQTAGDRAATLRLKSGVAICGGFPTGGGAWEQRNPFLHQSVLSGNIGDPEETGDNSCHVVNGSGADNTAILDGCTITGGCADGIEPQDRGAGLYVLSGSPQIRNCIFVANTAAGNGGGACTIESDATFTNCVFNSNTAGNCGGGLYHEQGNVTVTNCTFGANQGLWRGGGLFNESGAAAVANCILWANGRMNGGMYDDLAQVSGEVKPALDHCCVQGWTGSLGGPGNFGAEPLFVDADGPDDVAGTPDDDLRLQAGTRCIDGGNNGAVPADVTTDQQGNPRVIQDVVDIGAYEFGAAPAGPEAAEP